ncbi:hypothetical protein ASF54_10240 [Frondihabitans sp. Leaf304]|nr:hypothetical protein ASF54_10240 [Frondihabitans sp. Leaf304]
MHFYGFCEVAAEGLAPAGAAIEAGVVRVLQMSYSADMSMALAKQNRPSVGVRELKQNASRVLADVQAENLGRIITVNGRAVAALVPLAEIIVDEPEHRIEKIGIPRDELLARLAGFPLPPLSREDADSWMADIRSAYGDDDVVTDPYERNGL